MVETKEMSGHGNELYNAVQRLIFEWRGCDEGERTEATRQLIGNLVKLAQGNGAVARAAGHDAAEAA